ncbi:transcription elongation factor [Mycena polygramma]|nr:transcription elongation factor [Mycena polygramma]
MPDAAYLKETVEDLKRASAESNIQVITTLLLTLQEDFNGTEFIFRKSEARWAVKQLLKHRSKDVSDLAGNVLGRWNAKKEGFKPAVAVRTRVAAGKRSGASNGHATPRTPSGPTPNVRTLKSDGVEPDIVHDSKRNKCIGLVYDALASDSGAPVDAILDKAKAIEAAVFRDLDSTTMKYSDKIRFLLFNLKDKNNPRLREAVRGGEISVGEFVKMTSHEMASEEQKNTDDAIKEQNLRDLLGPEQHKAEETDAFQCPQCEERKTYYAQLQTRSADEPTTIFVTCVHCNHRWREY